MISTAKQLANNANHRLAIMKIVSWSDTATVRQKDLFDVKRFPSIAVLNNNINTGKQRTTTSLEVT